MFLVNVVSTFAVLVTVGLNCAGIITCRKIISEGTVGATPYLPFVAGFLMGALWLCYGFLRGDPSIMLVNSIGAVLQFSYIVLFSIYVENKNGVLRDAGISVVLVGAAAVYFLLLFENTSRNQAILGVICNIFTVLFFSSPLASMSVVIKTKSTVAMSLPLSVMSALASGSWLLYGSLIGDIFVMFPNGLGLLLSLIQLSLFLIYPSHSPGASSHIEI